MGHDGHEHDGSHGHSHHHPHHRHGHSAQGHSHEGHDSEAHGHGHQHHAEGGSKSLAEHRAASPDSVAVYVVTCSDTRSEASDETGAYLRSALAQHGHTVCGYQVAREDAPTLRATLDQAREAGARAVIFNGGTGIGRRDITLEVLRPLFVKELPGFGELFRALSFREVGSAAMLSRAAAGTVEGMMVFALPGSPHAAKLALEALILPELGHLVRELFR